MPFTFSPITDFQQLNFFLKHFTEYVNSFAKIVTDSYTGTGAQLEIHVGYMPEFIIVTDDDNNSEVVLWYKSFIGTNSKSSRSGAIYTNAILGLAPKRDGFLLGINTAVNTSGHVYRYLVIGH